MMILFAIPTYFAMEFAFEKEMIINELALQKYANKLEKNIYSEEIGLTRSVGFKFAVYNKKSNELISTLSTKLNNYNFKTKVEYPYMFYKKNVDKNIYGISFLVCEIKINYSKIILIATILFFIVLINIYILNKVIIKNTAKTYELMQKYTNAFFNDTMHELKTPLGVININLDLLVKKSEANKYTQRIKTALKQMQITYEDIEYYIKNKRIKYQKERLNFSMFVSSRISFFKDFADSKGMNIESKIEDELYIFMNSLELQRLMDNTISNAIKYSNPRTKIEVILKKENGKGLLIIRDHGYGIRDTKEVFNRFKREDEAQGGFGLGLNIVKNICNKNDIKISIDSKVDHGSTFKYEIDLYKDKFLDRIENDF